jgi:glycosyltransferase involved in cell wall biosynthesis
MIYILLATYNGEKYLKEQLDSLFNQSYHDWVLWVHDDNSKDSTVDIIKEFEKKNPAKIKFVDDDIYTGGAKENYDFLLSTIDDNYDYIMFCDQDDVWYENKIRITLDKMIEVENKNFDEPVLIHTDLKVVDEKLKTISISYFDYQHIIPKWSKNKDISLVQNSVTGCTMMINKNAIKISCPISQNAIMHDWWILLRVLQHNGVVEYIDQPTLSYRQHPLNDTGAKGFSFIKLLSKISSFKKYKNMSDDLNISKPYFVLLFYKMKTVIARSI